MAEVEIPLDIIIEILTRLPAKPLFRFKCVSKSWNSLISSLFKSNPKLNIIIKPHGWEWNGYIFSALIDDEDNNNESNLNFSNLNHPLNYNSCRVIDSCGGILLISDCNYETMCLYNPANIPPYKWLPPISSCIWNFESHCRKFFGFGYDSQSDDHKVIRVFQNPGVSLEICVYALKGYVWKFIRDESVSLHKYGLTKYSDGVSANGVVYFETSVPKDFKPALICFDVRTEAVSILDYPELLL